MKVEEDLFVDEDWSDLGLDLREEDALSVEVEDAGEVDGDAARARAGRALLDDAGRNMSSILVDAGRDGDSTNGVDAQIVLR